MNVGIRRVIKTGRPEDLAGVIDVSPTSPTISCNPSGDSARKWREPASRSRISRGDVTVYATSDDDPRIVDAGGPDCDFRYIVWTVRIINRGWRRRIESHSNLVNQARSAGIIPRRPSHGGSTGIYGGRNMAADAPGQAAEVSDRRMTCKGRPALCLG